MRFLIASSHPKTNEFKGNVDEVSVDFLYSIRDVGVKSDTTDQLGNVMSREDLEKSLKDNGFIDPLLIRIGRDMTIRLEEGNHRIQVAKKWGLKKVPAVLEIDETVDRKNGHDHLFKLKTEVELPDEKYVSPTSVLKQLTNGDSEG